MYLEPMVFIGHRQGANDTVVIIGKPDLEVLNNVQVPLLVGIRKCLIGSKLRYRKVINVSEYRRCRYQAQHNTRTQYTNKEPPPRPHC
jgi:hypothetical protein